MWIVLVIGAILLWISYREPEYKRPEHFDIAKEFYEQTVKKNKETMRTLRRVEIRKEQGNDKA